MSERRVDPERRNIAARDTQSATTKWRDSPGFAAARRHALVGRNMPPACCYRFAKPPFRVSPNEISPGDRSPRGIFGKSR